MKSIIPNGNTLVVLVGPSGAGKSTLAAQLGFKSEEIISTDAIRVELTGDVRRQDKNDAVMDEVGRRVKARLQNFRRAVVDATHIRDSDRLRTVSYGLDCGSRIIYLVVNRPVEAKIRTAGWREGVTAIDSDKSLIQAHEDTFQANKIKILSGDDLGIPVIDYQNLPEGFSIFAVNETNHRPQGLLDPALTGFSKIRAIGDVHGNLDGLQAALQAPEDTLFLFLGDIVDYGKNPLETTKIVEELVAHGKAMCIRGNHEKKILKFVNQLLGGPEFQGQMSHGNNVTLNQLKALPQDEMIAWCRTFSNLVEMSPDWIELDTFLFTHGACHHSMWGNNLFRAHKNSIQETFALYGETDGKSRDEMGFPMRLYNWVDDIPTAKTVVVGHHIMSVDDPVTMTGSKGGKAIFLDTGSSKDYMRDPTRPGKLSWMDLDIDQYRSNTNPGYRLRFNSYGSEK